MVLKFCIVSKIIDCPELEFDRFDDDRDSDDDEDDEPVDVLKSIPIDRNANLLLTVAATTSPISSNEA